MNLARNFNLICGLQIKGLSFLPNFLVRFQLNIMATSAVSNVDLKCCRSGKNNKRSLPSNGDPIKELPLKEINLPQLELAPKRKSETQKKMVKSPKLSDSSARPFTVSVEGNIGSGKSTFLNYFSSCSGVTTYQEPIDKWTNVGGHNLLQKLYEDPQRWSFLFQSYIQLTRLQIHLANATPGVKLIERSLHNNRYCFVESDFQSGNIAKEEYEVVCQYFNTFEKNFDIGIDLIVYLRTTPEIVFGRMKKRGRSEESGVPLEYLKRVHNYYEKWLVEGKPKAAPSPVIVINGDMGMDDIVKEYEQNRSLILGKCRAK